MVFIHRFLPAGLILLLLVGSPVEAGKEDGRGQGRWRRAFASAIKDADTWAPAAAAAAIAVGGYDKKISDWATRTTPLFGSRETAVKASDDLRLASDIGMAASSFFLTRQSGGPRSIQGRTAYTGVGYVGAIFSTSMTDVLKAATGRLRPDGSNTSSLPSGHTSRAFAYAAFSQRTLRESGLPKGVRMGLRWSLTGLAAGTAWARVEAGAHYPTDVLVGAGLGNFAGKFVSELILGPESEMHFSFNLNPEQPQVLVGWSF